MKEQKMLFDRIKLKLNLIETKENAEEIKGNLKENGVFIYKIDSFKNYYFIKKKFFNIYYYPVKRYIILDFNMQRFFTDVNIGGTTTKEALEVIKTINNYFKKNIGIKLDIRGWEVYYLELKKDLRYKNKKQKTMVIDNCKKCTKGNLKFGNYNTSYYRYTKNNSKINVYDKMEEVKSHHKKINAEEFAIIHNVIRFEVAFGNKKIKKILGADKVLFKNILDIHMQEKIFNDYFLKMGFSVGLIPSKIKLINKIKALALGKKKTENIIKFIRAINKFTFKKVKEMFPSAYAYLKILRENNLPIYFLDVEEKEVFQEKIKENKEKTPIIELKNKVCNKLYNIYGLFNNKLFVDIPKLE